MMRVNDTLCRAIEAFIIPVAALLATMMVFGLFVAASGVNPLDMYVLMYKGGFGTWFSWQNTLQRAAPLILTALCTAIPAPLGLIIIGGEGALVLGGLGAAMVARSIPGAPPVVTQIAMGLAGAVVGGCFILLAGALRHYRGVNETISSLLLTYMSIADYLFNAAPYVLTLIIMIITSSPRQSLAGAPGELSVTR